jgi:hypothetical protein
MSSSSKCKIDFDIELQLVFVVIHRLVSRTQCKYQSQDENATRIGQDQDIVLLGTCPGSLIFKGLKLDHEVDLGVINLVTLHSY